MILLPKDKTGFVKSIDLKYRPETSVVLRYRNAFRFKTDPKEDARFKKWLSKTSIREGMRIFSLLNYRGVEIHILDTTSLMRTKTLKALDGCVTIAHCKLKGYRKVAFESGGNTGAALTAYGQRAGLETFLFMPEDNLPLLDSEVFSSPRAHLIAVQNPGLIKETCRRFAKTNNLKHIPELSWRYEASMFRGLFILESLLKDSRFDWLTQTISAGFGPVGIYRILKGFKKELKVLPRFLGIQQEANCPMYKFWKSKGKTIGAPNLNSTKQLLTKVMYDVKPQTYGTYQEMVETLVLSRGALTTVNSNEFSDFLKDEPEGENILDLLKKAGIPITVKNNDVVEKTGLIALAGTLKEIRNGRITKGNKVLCCLTSGVTDADGKAKPECRI